MMKFSYIRHNKRGMHYKTQPCKMFKTKTYNMWATLIMVKFMIQAVREVVQIKGIMGLTSLIVVRKVTVGTPTTQLPLRRSESPQQADNES